jgi:hypothetical protein
MCKNQADRIHIHNNQYKSLHLPCNHPSASMSTSIRSVTELLMATETAQNAYKMDPKQLIVLENMLPRCFHAPKCSHGVEAGNSVFSAAAEAEGYIQRAEEHGAHMTDDIRARGGEHCVCDGGSRPGTMAALRRFTTPTSIHATRPHSHCGQRERDGVI